MIRFFLINDCGTEISNSDKYIIDPLEITAAMLNWLISEHITLDVGDTIAIRDAS